MKFIDLFAGLGGFHLALKKLGHECVYSCEINPTLREVYRENFGILPHDDIRTINISKLPHFDVLCAGFPCQPFSKAGKQMGTEDERGALFAEILKILRKRKPEYFLLENVPHLARHNQSETWVLMKADLKKAGYKFVDCREYSPHEFGIPQHRRRIYIVGSRQAQPDFEWIDDLKTLRPTNVRSILESSNGDARKLDARQLDALALWQEFLNVLEPDEPIGFPIWGYEYGATYPFERETPFSARSLSKYKGSFGLNLKGQSYNSEHLPSYARLKQERFPIWKQHYISQNRRLFKKYFEPLSPIFREIAKLSIPSWQKFEWNCQYESRDVWTKILQFRASGIRVKKADFTPSLVCTNTQIPIVAWEQRYLSTREALKLQSFPPNFKIPQIGNSAYAALGNAVNVRVVKLLAERLIGSEVKKEG